MGSEKLKAFNALVKSAGFDSEDQAHVHEQYTRLAGSGGGGRVTLAEFEIFMNNENVPANLASHLFRAFDEDGNGKVDGFELILGLIAMDPICPHTTNSPVQLCNHASLPLSTPFSSPEPNSSTHLSNVGLAGTSAKHDIPHVRSKKRWHPRS